MSGSLIKQYENACTKFQTVEREIQKILQTRVIRDAEIILNKKLDPDEIDSVLNHPEQVQEMYKNRLEGVAHQKIANFVSDIEERHKDLIKLEKVNIIN